MSDKLPPMGQDEEYEPDLLTLEDETGLTNVIVHPRLAERQRREMLSARLLGVLGVVQREGEVIHLVAKRLVDHSVLLGQLATRSRDFH